MSTYEARLAALREQLKADRLDGFVVPLTDEHMSEYVGSYAQRLAWLTGFQGSAGSAVVLPEEAAIFVDGRYTLQVRDQVDGAHWSYQSVPADQHRRLAEGARARRRPDRLRSLAAHQRLGDEGEGGARRQGRRAGRGRPQPDRHGLGGPAGAEPGAADRPSRHLCRREFGRQAAADGRLAEGAEGGCRRARRARFDRLDVQRARPGRGAHAGRALLRAGPRRRHRGSVRRRREDRRRRPPASRQRRPHPRAQRLRGRARRAGRQDHRGRSGAFGRRDLRGAGQGRRPDRRAPRPLDPAQGDQERGRDCRPPRRPGARWRRAVALPPLALGRGAEGRRRRAVRGGEAAGLPAGGRRSSRPQLRHHFRRRPERRDRPLPGQRGDQPAARDGPDLSRRFGRPISGRDHRRDPHGRSSARRRRR